MSEISLFYSNLCIHCVNFKPVWDKMKEKFKTAGILYHEYNAEKDNEIFDKEKITGYPTIKITKDNNKYEFKGERTENEILKELGIKISFTKDELDRIDKTIKKLIKGGMLPENSKIKFKNIIKKY